MIYDGGGDCDDDHVDEDDDGEPSSWKNGQTREKQPQLSPHLPLSI